MSKKYFDVNVDVVSIGYEKEVTNRVRAFNAHEAIIAAICNEAITLSDDEVEQQVNHCDRTGKIIKVEDADFTFQAGEVIELEELEVEYKGEQRTVLLPKDPKKLSLYSRSRYFA